MSKSNFRGFVGGFFFVLVCYGMLLLFRFSPSVNESISVADGFTIEGYEVSLDVKEDLKVDVIERITVNWYEEFHHGIYKFTPLWYKYTSSDNKTMQRKSVIKNYRALDDNYSLDMVKKKARIKIGDADKYVDLGKKTYTIAYTYDMGKDPYHGFDEFIFHAYGDYWGTPIKNASIKVNLPKTIEANKVKFFTDKYRQNDITQKLTININDNTIYAKSHSPLDSSLTVDVLLPEGYFVGGSYNYTNISLLLIIGCIALTIVTIITWFRYGKDYPKRAKTVEYYAPDDLSSAEIGYVSGNTNINKLTISLIVGIASKGYIKIDDEKGNKIKITNLVIKPLSPKYLLDNLPKRKICVGMLKNPGNDLSAIEITLMKFLFKKSTYKELNSNFTVFDENKDSLINKGYIEVISDNQKEIEQIIADTKGKYTHEYDEYDRKLAEYNAHLNRLEPLNQYESVVYNQLIDAGDEFYLSEHTTFYHVFSKIYDLIQNGISKKINDMESYSKIWPSFLRLVITIIFSIVAYTVVEDLDPRLHFLYYMSFVCIPVSLLFIIFMTRKTQYGEEIKARVAGFKDLLLKVEKPQLERFVNENPKYFYNILPYTYVLGISRKWVAKFENIPYPKIDMGSFDYFDDSSYTRFSSNVYHPVSHGSSSSGCSSCGGGCSSCGGGCSSCGGGGSW